MSSGVLLILVGVWVGSQVLGGGALKRLGVVEGQRPTKVNRDPATGVPNQNPSLPLLRDQNGNPY